MRIFVVMLGLLIAFSGSADELQQFDLTTLLIGNHKVAVQLADTDEKRAQGLMFQQTAEPGMLLLYQTPRPISLWMRNTVIPLDVAFIDANWRISAILPLQPLNETSVFSPGPVIAALEMPQGWFAAQNIQPGVLVQRTDD